ncbi:uncharacterized protein METZ01_LOCUS273888, partial [marine metagenome]
RRQPEVQPGLPVSLHLHPRRPYGSGRQTHSRWQLREDQVPV